MADVPGSVAPVSGLPGPDPARVECWLIALRAGVGASDLRRLCESDGIRRIGSTSAAQLRSSGIPAAAVPALLDPDPALLSTDRAWLAQPGHALLTWDSDDYPALLREAPNPPAALFISGDLDLLWQPQIAIVGSRNPSSGGRDNARDFAATLARSGFVITSGLADGIDAAAHGAALRSGHPTIAVIGTGPDRVYPLRNRELSAAIEQRGCLVSEFLPGTSARKDHFPRRNRIIAGLSLGTLVVEAALRSGALISARLASECSREVFALPGSIHNPMARGCHRLIRDGAALVESAQEIVEALGPTAQRLASALRGRLTASESPPAARPGTAPGTDPARAALLSALGHDPTGIDDLSLRTGLTVADLSSMLLIMELEGQVSADHGRYARRRT